MQVPSKYEEYHQHWLEVQALIEDPSIDNQVIGQHLKSLTEELGSLEVEYDRFETV